MGNPYHDVVLVAPNPNHEPPLDPDAMLYFLPQLRIDVESVNIDANFDPIHGAYCDVFRGTWQQGTEHRLIAIKRRRGNGRSHLNMGVHELKTLAGITHPNIIKLSGFTFNDKDNVLSLISPFHRNGNLVHYLDAFQPSFPKRLDLAIDITNAVAHLHDVVKICHGDIKGANILVDDTHQALLCDFSFARSVNGDIPFATSSLSGTARYFSPEMVATPSPGRTKSSDVWALACLLLFILTKQLPFSSAKTEVDVLRALAEGSSPVDIMALDVPEPIRTLLGECWKEHTLRPSIQQCFHTLISVKYPHLSMFRIESPSTAAEDLRSSHTLPLTQDAFAALGAEWLDVESNFLDMPTNLLITTSIPGELIRLRVRACGGFADVEEGEWTRPDGTKIRVGIKFYRDVKMRSSKTDDAKRARRKTRLVRETIIWSGLEHPNIAPLLGFDSENECFLITEWCPYGDLEDYIRDHPDLPMPQRLELLIGTGYGFAYLHSRDPPIAHGDGKPSNVLVDDTITPRIVDFGLSRAIYGDGEERHAHLITSGGAQGSKGYQAPELLFDTAERSLASDVYAFGGIILAVLSGKDPYHKLDASKTVIAISKNQLPHPSDHPNLPGVDSAWRIIRDCLSADPSDRPTMTEVVNRLNMRLIE